jgi:D-alanine--poly(phosphoribitol) ligase subunit 1
LSEAVPCLGAAFLETVMRYPNAPALWVDGCAFSYEEVRAQAARIANGILAVGVGAGSRCVILGSRSMSAFTGLLGAVLARCTYVPVNPRHPVARLTSLLVVAGAKALIVDGNAEAVARDVLGRLERGILVVLPDAAIMPDWTVSMPWHRFLCRSDLCQAGISGLPAGDPEDGAYLMFTSGSTGTPKGVLVRNGNVLAYLRNAFERYRPGPGDRFTQLFDLTFDLSVHDIFLCWSAGATLFCPPESARLVPRDFVRRHGLTFWFSVPSTVSFMARFRALRPNDFPTIRWSLFCGEALPRSLALLWAKAAPNSVIENLYGPTEATIAITAFRVPANPAAAAHLPEIVPIGAPLRGQQAVIIRADDTPAPDGEEGELCLSGAQVTDGYWQDPELTTERFKPPAMPGAKGRWYRTGDRARATDEHGLVFLGRLDRQVKVNGYRIELQGVEAALRHAGGTGSVAAIAWPVDDDGLARGIVAFVMEGGVTGEAVLGRCREILPHYMVPSCVHLVADWPTSDNGKTDYKQLRHMLE